MTTLSIMTSSNVLSVAYALCHGSYIIMQSVVMLSVEAPNLCHLKALKGAVFFTLFWQSNFEGFFRTFFDLFWPFSNFFDLFWTFSNFFDLFRTFSNFFDLFGLFGTFFDLFSNFFRPYFTSLNKHFLNPFMGVWGGFVEHLSLT